MSEGRVREAVAADVAAIVALQREAAHRFYERLGFVASHVGLKLYLGPRSGGEA